MKRLLWTVVLSVWCVPVTADDPSEDPHAQVQGSMLLAKAAQQAMNEGQFEAAAQKYREAMEVQSRVLAVQLDQLAQLLSEQSKHAQAEPLLNALLALKVDEFGAESPAAREVQSRLLTGTMFQLIAKPGPLSPDDVLSALQMVKGRLELRQHMDITEPMELESAGWTLTQACSALALALSWNPEVARSEVGREAVEIASAVVEIPPHNNIAIVTLAWLQYHHGTLTEAEKTLERLTDSAWSDVAGEYYLRALLADAAGQRERAEDLFVVAREQFIKYTLLPNQGPFIVFPKRLQTIAAQHLQLDEQLPVETWNPDQFIDVYSRLCGQLPHLAHLHFRHGSQFARKGQWEQAAAAYRVACELAPNDGGCWRALIAITRQAGNVEECDRLCREAYEHFREPETVSSWSMHAQTLMADFCTHYPVQDFDYEDLYEWMCGNAEQNAESAWHQRVKSFAAYRSGRLQETLDAEDEVARLDKNPHPFDQYIRSMAHYRLGNTEQAAALYDVAVTIAQGMVPQTPAISAFEDMPVVWCETHALAREAAELMNLPYAPTVVPPTPSATQATLEPGK